MKKDTLIVVSALLIFLFFVIYKIAIFIMEHKFFIISALIFIIIAISLFLKYSKYGKRRRKRRELERKKKILYEKYGVLKQESKKEELKQEEIKTRDIYEYEQKWANEQREQKRQSNIQKGKAYEFFVGNYFKQRGYKIYYQGVNQGLKDYGIDLIAYKGNETMLIQCKNWEKWKINKKILDKFNNDCDRYIEYHQRQTRYKSIKRVFVVANTNLTQDAKNKLFSPSNNIEFLHIPTN